MRGLRVGLVTYHFSDNFGAVLQAYALRKWFLDNGCFVDFINYHPSYVEEGGDFVSVLNLRNAKINIKILYLKLLSLKRVCFGNKQQLAAFEDFRHAELGVRGERIFDMKSNEAVLDGYDLLVCGSDQIWNPSAQRGLDPTYFLSFSKKIEGRRCISYAASFGKGSLDSKYHDQAKALIRQLDAVSVREKSGVSIVQSVSGVSAACVPDPTILLGKFDSLLSGDFDIKYRNQIFCYALRTGDGVREVADLASRLFEAKIYSPYNPHRRWKEVGETVYPSPSEWIRMLNESKVVVTNSFHGVALSIVCNRPFVFVSLGGAKMSLNERVLSLVGQVGLEHRVVSSQDMAKAEVLLTEAIDWDSVNEKVAALRSVGEHFLNEQLDRVKS
jgi:hypothetical protein